MEHLICRNEFFRRIFCRRNDNRGQQEEVELQSCSNSFDEHHLTLHSIVERYPDSQINESHLTQSQGGIFMH